MKKIPAIGALLLASSMLYGQQTPSDPRALEEIVVQAMRMDRSLQRIPAAVSVVGRDEIQMGRQQLGLDESLAKVPGLFMQNRYNFAQDLRVAIRGFGARSNFGIRGIKILVDGIPETLPDGQGQVDSIDLGTVEQIEVIRGPSSTLYGNASGGVISVTSESGPEEPFGEIRLSAGEYGFRKLQVKSGGRTEDLDYFISLSDSTIDGYREHSEAKNTQLTGRLKFQLKDDADFLTVFNYSDQPVSNDPGGINASQATSNPRSARDRNLLYDTGEALKQTRLGFVYSKPTSSAGQLNIRSYFVWRDFQNKLPQFPVADGVDLERFFAGGGLSYTKAWALGGKPNRMIVGLDVDNQDDDRRRFKNDKGIRGNLRFEQNEHVSSYGAFIQDEISLSDNLELSFGLRHDEIKFDVSDRFLSDGNDSGQITLSDTSPMIGIMFGISPILNIYGTISTSFETPTTTEYANPTGGGGFNLQLGPQTATNHELGIRGNINDRYYYEVAIFDIDVKGELVPYEVDGRNFFRNAGKSDRKGIEFGFTANPSDRTTISVTYTFADYKFDEFFEVEESLGIVDITNFSGNKIPGTVDHLFHSEISYTHPSGWYSAWNILYVDDQFTNNANTGTNKAYILSNIRAGLERKIGKMLVSPFIGINNLFDESYNANVRINAFGKRFFEPGPDRNLYAGINLRFDFR